ncbi:MAG: Cro/CI family transcriptional regulator [Motiliproteus sp.]
MKKLDAIKHFGSPSKLAKALDIHPASVSQWGDEIPQLRAYQLERLTGGVLKADDQPKHSTAA